MTTPRKVRFTDRHRYPRPYADSKASAEPGYLAARFAAIRAEQEANAREAQAKVSKIKERK